MRFLEDENLKNRFTLIPEYSKGCGSIYKYLWSRSVSLSPVINNYKFTSNGNTIPEPLMFMPFKINFPTRVKVCCCSAGMNIESFLLFFFDDNNIPTRKIIVDRNKQPTNIVSVVYTKGGKWFRLVSIWKAPVHFKHLSGMCAHRS